MISPELLRDSERLGLLPLRLLAKWLPAQWAVLVAYPSATHSKPRWGERVGNDSFRFLLNSSQVFHTEKALCV